MASRVGPSMRPPRGGGLIGRIRRLKTYVIPFTDHSGREALMVFEGVVSCPLPPLYSFAIYFTHAQVTLETVKPVEVLEAITRNTPFDTSRAPIRLELYLLPAPDVDSSDDECIAHYHKEKAARGDYMRQVRDVENSATHEEQQGTTSIHGNDQARQQRLPGLVPSYVDRPIRDYYHGMIFRYSGADWSTDKRPVRRICFDRISEEKYIRVTGDDDFHSLPLVNVRSMPFQESDTTELGETFIGMAMFEAANGRTKNETIGPFHEAEERGWKSW